MRLAKCNERSLALRGACGVPPRVTRPHVFRSTRSDDNDGGGEGGMAPGSEAVEDRGGVPAEVVVPGVFGFVIVVGVVVVPWPWWSLKTT